MQESVTFSERLPCSIKFQYKQTVSIVPFFSAYFKSSHYSSLAFAVGCVIFGSLIGTSSVTMRLVLTEISLLFVYLALCANSEREAKITAERLHPFEDGSEPPHTHVHITVDDDDDDSEEDSHDLTKTEWDDLTSDEQDAVVAKFFKHLDKNGDGFVSRQEIHDKIFDELLDESFRFAEEDFADIDEDKNKHVTWEEYYGPVADEEEEEDDELEKLRFKLADTDATGTLDLNEFKIFNYPYESDHMQEYLLKKVMTESDADGDGKISSDEFETLSTEFEAFRDRANLFKLFDKDSNSFLERQELLELLNGSTARLAESETEWLTSKMVPSPSDQSEHYKHDKWDLEGIAANIDYFIESNFEEHLMRLHTEL